MAIWDHNAKQWTQLTNDGEPIPAWVKARQAHITSALKYEPPRVKLKKAWPLTHEHLADALAELGSVFQAYELEGLDVWFVKLVDMDRGTGHNVILYEFRGEWLCSSIERVKLFRPEF